MTLPGLLCGVPRRPGACAGHRHLEVPSSRRHGRGRSFAGPSPLHLGMVSDLRSPILGTGPHDPRSAHQPRVATVGEGPRASHCYRPPAAVRHSPRRPGIPGTLARRCHRGWWAPAGRRDALPNFWYAPQKRKQPPPAAAYVHTDRGTHLSGESTMAQAVLTRANVRILIIEDHMLFAESMDLALTIEGYDVRRLPVPDVGSSQAALLSAITRLRPRIVLLDLDLGHLGDGVRLIAPIARTGAHVVVVTASADRGRRGECLRYGARKVLTKARPL